MLLPGVKEPLLAVAVEAAPVDELAESVAVGEGTAVAGMSRVTPASRQKFVVNSTVPGMEC